MPTIGFSFRTPSGASSAFSLHMNSKSLGNAHDYKRTRLAYFVSSNFVHGRYFHPGVSADCVDLSRGWAMHRALHGQAEVHKGTQSPSVQKAIGGNCSGSYDGMCTSRNRYHVSPQRITVPRVSVEMYTVVAELGGRVKAALYIESSVSCVMCGHSRRRCRLPM